MVHEQFNSVEYLLGRTKEHDENGRNEAPEYGVEQRWIETENEAQSKHLLQEPEQEIRNVLRAHQGTRLRQLTDELDFVVFITDELHIYFCKQPYN